MTAVRRSVASTASLTARWERQHWLSAGCIGATLLLVASIAPGFSVASLQRDEPAIIAQPLQLPAPSATTAAPIRTSTANHWIQVTVRGGQSLGSIFAEQGLSGTELQRLLQHPGAREPLTRIRPGDQFEFDRAEDGSLRAIRFAKDEASQVTLRLSAEGIRESIQSRPLQHRVLMASGEIRESLFADGERAGLSVGTILELAKAFGYDIDFAQDLREGDRFDVVYEEIWRDGERLRSGDVLAATFFNQGKRYQVFRYLFADGRSEYYDAEGRPMKKSFLRMPIEFARISSRFNSARRHPILGTIRAHQGVDYAAGNGTPIMAAGEGRILFAGVKGGYGRAVILDHGNRVTTLYGHMSRFGKYRTGARVRQGDVIGYVGASGLATGPHLHYEFRVAGAHRDPLKVTLPKPQPLPRSELARFQLQVLPMRSQLALLEGGRGLASR